MNNKVVFPREDWMEASPESQGIDSCRLKAAMDYLKQEASHVGIEEVVLVRNGYMIWKGNQIGNRHVVYSCTKSFTSTVLGLLVDDGACTLDTLAADYLPYLKEKYSKIALKHFATMTSGYNAIGHTYDEDGSLNPFVPNEPMFSPGTKFMYWDDATNLYGNVLTRIANESMKDFFKRRIADKIGMSNWDWIGFGEIDGLYVCSGAGNNERGIMISARDMARFGLLYLNKGCWNGEQLLSESWVLNATGPQVPYYIPFIVYPSRPHLDGRGIYGFNWWVNGVKFNGERRFTKAPINTFFASGYCNNKCFVIPEWNMVFVMLGTEPKRITDDTFNEFLGMLGDAIVN